MSEHALFFVQTMQEFLSSLHEVYPECIKVGAYELAFRTKIKNKSDERLKEMAENFAIPKYTSVMAPWFERCARKDESLLSEQIEFLSDLAIPAKWPQMDADTRNTVWDYIIQLNSYCGGPIPPEVSTEDDILPENVFETPGMPAEISGILQSMPTGLQLSISSTARKYSEKINNGSLTLADLDIMGLARDVYSSVDADELHEFGQTLKSGQVTVDMASMTNMMNSMGPDTLSPGMTAAISGMLRNK